MKKHFYTHLIEYKSISIKIHELDADEVEKKHLHELAEANLHHTILDTILSELGDDDKHVFLENVTKGDHDKIWGHLKDKVEKIEEKILTKVYNFQKELHRDIEDAKKQK